MTECGKYRRIGEVLRREIAQTCQPGDRLPPEVQLASRFQVNRHTIRRALGELVEEGLLSRRQGRGTVVLRRPLEIAIHRQTQFNEQVESLGRKPDTEVLRSGVVAPSPHVRQRLGLSRRCQAVEIELLRSVDGVPVVVSSHFLPASPFAPLADDYRGGSLHRLISRQFGVALRRTESIVTAELPAATDAILLAMFPRMPVLRVESLNVNTDGGVPVELAISRFCADRALLKVNP